MPKNSPWEGSYKSYERENAVIYKACQDMQTAPDNY